MSHWVLQSHQVETIELGRKNKYAMFSQTIAIKATNAAKTLNE